LIVKTGGFFGTASVTATAAIIKTDIKREADGRRGIVSGFLTADRKVINNGF